MSTRPELYRVSSSGSKMKSDKTIDSAPEDRKSFVYAVFYWLGIGTLLPWNFFISVPAYWDHKWRPVNETFDAALSNETIAKSGKSRVTASLS